MLEVRDIAGRQGCVVSKRDSRDKGVHLVDGPAHGLSDFEHPPVDAGCGKIEIEYYSAEDLGRIYDVIVGETN